MKYESSILKRLIDTYGVIGNPRYLSENIKEFIVRGKELYPQLFTYQSDWLAHIDEFGLTPEYTVSYTGQHIYAPNTKEKPVKSAILLGNTESIIDRFENGSYNNNFEKVGCGGTRIRIINPITNITNFSITLNDGFQILYWIKKNDGTVSASSWSANTNLTLKITDQLVFAIKKSDNSSIICEEVIQAVNSTSYKNLTELKSVKMPVLTTTGKNLFDGKIELGGIYSNGNDAGNNQGGITDRVRSANYIPVNPNTTYILSDNESNVINANFYEYDENKTFIYSIASVSSVNTKSSTRYIRFINRNTDTNVKYQLEEGSVATPYEPYKSNILTVNEDVELGSVGEVKDEINLLTAQLTQRTETRAYQEGDESNSEVLTDMTNTRYKLPKEVIKTVDLTIHDKDQQKVERLTSFEGGTHFTTSSQDGSLLPTLSIDVVTDLEETLAVCSLEGNTM